ncbi:MAG: ABC transporter ATP-binding protein [Candidatus Omnitrophota bacterium]
MGETVLELRGVHFSYAGKYPALCGIDLAVDRGEKRAIIGANGSGKSTLLQMLDGLIFPDRGAVAAFGREVSGRTFSDEAFSRGFRKRVGFLFQNPDVQLFCPSVKEDILFGPLQLKEDKAETKKRFDRIVSDLGIEGLLDRSPHQLSVGEKRKVAIASTLIIDPEVLLLDEPTAGLDPLTTRHIIDILNKENASGKTIVTSTHDLHIVEEIADSVSVFSRDKTIVKSGHSHEILGDIALLQAHNLVHIHAHRHDGVTHVHPHDHPSHDHAH